MIISDGKCASVCVCVLVRLHLIWFIKNKTHFCWNFKYHKSGTFFVRSFAEGSVLYGEFDYDMVNCSMGCYNVLKASFIQMLLIRFYFIRSNLTLNEVKEIDFLNSSDRYTCVYTLNIAPNLMESNSYPRAHLAALNEIHSSMRAQFRSFHSELPFVHRMEFIHTHSANMRRVSTQKQSQAEAKDERKKN